MMEIRVLAYLVWAATTVLVYGVVFWRMVRKYRVYRDRRATREFLTSLALFVTSLVSFFSILSLVLFDPSSEGFRLILTVLALGSFTGAGIVWLQETPKERRSEPRPSDSDPASAR